MSPAQCHRHGPVWLARCQECREARAATLLRSVQSCTLHAPDQRKHAPGAVGRHPAPTRFAV